MPGQCRSQSEEHRRQRRNGGAVQPDRPAVHPQGLQHGEVNQRHVLCLGLGQVRRGPALVLRVPACVRNHNHHHGARITHFPQVVRGIADQVRESDDHRRFVRVVIAMLDQRA